MKIAYINDQLFPNTETDCEQIMQTVYTLGKNGAEITLILPEKFKGGHSSANELSDFYQIEPSFSLEYKKSFFPSYRFIEKTAHAVISLFSKSVRKCDVIYTRNLPTVISVLAFTNKPVIYETYRNWPDQLFFMGWLFRRFDRSQKFLGAVIHSEFAAESFIRAGVSKNKILPKQNGYDPKRISPVLTKSEARKKLGLPQNRRIVTYAGHVSPKKGIDIILDLAQVEKKAYFVIAGSKERTAIEERAETMENVKIVPWLKFDKVVEYLYASDILVIPPTLGPLHKVGNTVLPIKTFLYMATKRVIFGPDSPDLASVLKNNVNAKLVEPDNFEKAHDGLSELISSEELCERLSSQAYNDVKDLTYLKRSSDILGFIQKRLHEIK
ncbi:MAG TPA: glycosyltransferase [bacterium]|nr:glycosyltransferase [bacterium]HPS31344.1 glycosyltransferase [bacterium]